VVQLGEHAPAVVLDVEQHRPPERGQGGRLVAAGGLQRQGAGRDRGETLDVLGPPRQLAELHKARQLAQLPLAAALRGEGVGRVAQGGARCVRIGLDGRHRGQEPPARMGPPAGGEPGQPIGQHVRSDRGVRRAERVDDGGRQLGRDLGPGVGSGVEQQRHRRGRVASAPQHRGRAVTHVRRRAWVDVPGEQRPPHGVQDALTARQGGDQGQAPDERLDVGPVEAQHGGGEVGVERAQVRQQPERPAPGGRQAGEHLLAHVVGVGAGGRAGRQLGHRRPAAAAGQRGGRDPPQRGERGQLVVVEPEVRLVEPRQPTGDVEAGQGQRRRRPTAQHDVPIGRQRRHDRGEQRSAVRTRRDLVDVVDDQRHLLG
jgi:hypothetical protein